MERKIEKSRFDVTKYTSLIGLILVVIASAVLSPAFLKPENVLNVLRQIVPNGIIACGMTLVILTAGIDLSAGSLLALSGVSASLLMQVMPWPAAIVLVLVLASGLGAVVGLTITKLKVPPFIVTLAGLTVYRGVAMAMTGAVNIYITDKGFSQALGNGRLAPIVIYALLGAVALYFVYNFINQMRKTEKKVVKQLFIVILAALGIGYFAYLVTSEGYLNVQIIYYLIVLALTYFILNKTVWGRQIYAVGGNYKAAKMAGIKADATLIKVYMLMTTLAALSGIFSSAKLQSGMPNAGNNAELDAIAAVVIGGTSLMGGVGRITGTIVGVLLIGVLNNMLSLVNASPDLQNIFKGLIILGAVIIDTKFKKQ